MVTLHQAQVAHESTAQTWEQRKQNKKQDVLGFPNLSFFCVTNKNWMRNEIQSSRTFPWETETILNITIFWTKRYTKRSSKSHGSLGSLPVKMMHKCSIIKRRHGSYKRRYVSDPSIFEGTKLDTERELNLLPVLCVEGGGRREEEEEEWMRPKPKHRTKTRHKSEMESRGSFSIFSLSTKKQESRKETSGWNRFSRKRKKKGNLKQFVQNFFPGKHEKRMLSWYLYFWELSSPLVTIFSLSILWSLRKKDMKYKNLASFLELHTTLRLLMEVSQEEEDDEEDSCDDDDHVCHLETLSYGKELCVKKVTNMTWILIKEKDRLP